MGKLPHSGRAAIQLDSLTKTFGAYHAVNGVSLEVNRGEIFGFIGLNGAGKSTTIHIMLSLLKPNSGSVYLLGSKVGFRSGKLWEKVGFLEEARYYPGLTVEENLDIARRMQRLPDQQCIPRIIQKLGLEAHQKKKAKNLSLNHGVTVFLSSHLLEEFAKLADIHKGNLVQEMFMATSLLTMFVSTVSAFLANVTRGYLAPIGLIFLIVIIVNVVENVGLSAYIPWTIPRLLFSDDPISPVSITILLKRWR